MYSYIFQDLRTLKPMTRQQCHLPNNGQTPLNQYLPFYNHSSEYSLNLLSLLYSHLAGVTAFSSPSRWIAFLLFLQKNSRNHTGDTYPNTGRIYNNTADKYRWSELL